MKLVTIHAELTLINHSINVDGLITNDRTPAKLSTRAIQPATDISNETQNRRVAIDPATHRHVGLLDQGANRLFNRRRRVMRKDRLPV